MKKINKKGSVFLDVIEAPLLIFALLIASVIVIFFNAQFDDTIQSSAAIPSQAKNVSNDMTDNKMIKIGYVIPILLISLFIYTIITAYFIEEFGFFWFMVGFIILIFYTFIIGLIKYLYSVFLETSIFIETINYFPFAQFYFEYIFYFQIAWFFLIFIVYGVRR